VNENIIEEAIELAEQRARLEIQIDEINLRLDELREIGGSLEANPRPRTRKKATRRKKTTRAKAETKRRKPKSKSVSRETDRPTKAVRPFGVEAASDFLRKMLANGPVPKSKVEDEANKDGFTKSTLYRARAKLGVVASNIVDQSTGKRVGTELSLP